MVDMVDIEVMDLEEKGDEVDYNVDLRDNVHMWTC
jgi:hypothetical protein